MSRRYPMHLPIWFFFCSVLCAAIYPSAEPIAAELPPSWLIQEEQNWLADHPGIRLAPDPGFSPIEFLDDAGNYRGIASDYVELIEEKLGISFTVVRFKRWDEILAAASNKEVDMLGAAAESEERSEYLAFTRPYLELPGHIITRKEAKGTITLNQLNAKKVAVVAGYIWQDFLKRDFPAIRLEPVDDVPTGLNKVSDGTVDAMVANLAVAMYYIHQNGLTNLRVAGAVDHVVRYAFATRKDWPILNRILEKALLKIGLDERTAILGKWIATEQTGKGSQATSATTLSSDMPSVQEIKASIASLEKNSDLAAATRDKDLELYRLAMNRIQVAEQTEQKAAEYRESMTSAPVETERIRKELELGIALKETGVEAIPAGVTRAQLKQRLSQAEAELARLQKARTELADQIKAQQGRPGKIQDELSETKLAIDRIEWRLAASPPLSGEDLLITEAEHLALKAQRRVDNAKAHLLEQELLSYDVRLELLMAEFNQTQVRQSRVESQVKRLQERTNQLLAEEAETAQQSAKQDLKEVIGKNPVLQKTAEKNTKLSQQLSELAVKIEAVTHRRETVDGWLTEFNRDLRSIEQQLEIAGHSPALAEVLISERRKLPNLRIYDRDARERRNQIASDNYPDTGGIRRGRAGELGSIGI